MASILENTVFYGFVTTVYTVPISTSPPEPTNIATFWVTCTFDILLNAAMISQNSCSLFVGGDLMKIDDIRM